MCLKDKALNKEFREWLKLQPREITAWKIMNKRWDWDGNPILTPSIMTRYQDMFYRENRITEVKDFITTSYSWEGRQRYRPYYHLWLERPSRIPDDRRKFEIIVECTVPKKFITAMRTNSCGSQILPAIISKGFDIRSKHWSYRKYFGEE